MIESSWSARKQEKQGKIIKNTGSFKKSHPIKTAKTKTLGLKRYSRLP